jgi:hypothetical protein
MQDEPGMNEYIIELIAKSLDEPLLPDEQRVVDQAMQESLALRVVSDSLQEFDALMKRTGMVIPEEGFPARVLLRIEAYEKSRTRTQWYFTLGVIALGSLAAVLFVVLNWSTLIDASIGLLTSAIVLVPMLLTLAIVLVRVIGEGPILLYAFATLLLTLLWVRVSGGFQHPTTQQ